jgi:hypothetical protein
MYTGGGSLDADACERLPGDVAFTLELSAGEGRTHHGRPQAAISPHLRSATNCTGGIQRVG